MLTNANPRAGGAAKTDGDTRRCVHAAVHRPDRQITLNENTYAMKIRLLFEL
jgi:hypothetical protein